MSDIREEIERLSLPQHGGRPWYQCVDFDEKTSTEAFGGGKIRYRTETFVDFLRAFPLQRDDRILDIGSNAGLFCLLCADRCADVIGVEIDEAFHRQALFLQDWFNNSGHRTENVRLLNQNLLEGLDLLADRTVIFASKVLYHKYLGDGVYKLIEAIHAAPVRAIVVQGHTTQGERGQNDGVAAMLKRYGFEFEVAVDHEEYPIGVAQRVV